VLTGGIVQALARPDGTIGELAYRAMFGALSAALVIALACYWRCPEKPAARGSQRRS
jgi:hypothetical protein